jgi:DNA (cytosine-5)-methyltransferase 1
MAGNRDKDWGKDKKFREGQAKQVLDTLFFDFIDLAKKLQPKVVVAENVKGLLLAGAQKYVAEILKQFDDAGYYVDYTLLNAAKMGVPQRRERVFFTAIRKDLFRGPFSDMFNTRPRLDLAFSEIEITFSVIKDHKDKINTLRPSELNLIKHRIKTDKGLGCIYKRQTGRDGFFSHIFIRDYEACGTITADSGGQQIIPELFRHLNQGELCSIGAFPQDYKPMKNTHKYLIGMSVPPVMTAQIATRIWEQWLT